MQLTKIVKPYALLTTARIAVKKVKCEATAIMRYFGIPMAPIQTGSHLPSFACF